MKKQNQNGITLIALVITIIVLLILAGITINLTIGEKGIITRAQQAGKEYAEAQAREEDELGKFTQEIDSILNSNLINGKYSEAKKVNSPKIVGTGLTAVEITSDGKLVNADTTKEDWYSYDGTQNHWANAKTKDESLWVWIPRFAYKITYKVPEDKSQGGLIDVVFLKDTTNLDSNGKDVTDANYVDEKGQTGAYIVHPAFKDGSKNGFPNGEWRKEISGFWMAKFEAGYEGNPGEPESAIDSPVGYSTIWSWNGTTNADLPNNYYGTRAVGTKIKYPVFQPNKPSMNYIPIADSYDLCQVISKTGNPYGLKSNTNSHLTKNSEWGAVAYLTHSKYGRNGDELTINNVSLNNTTNTIYAVTGYAGVEVSSGPVTTTLDKIKKGEQEGSWLTSQGQNASSTKNIYGIYDLSGGAGEWTAGYIATTGEQDNYTKYGGSLKGESNEFKSKYAGSSDSDVNYSTSPNETRKGEAIWEISVSGLGSTIWNGDYSYFPYKTEPFFRRGGRFDEKVNAGLYAFARHHGFGFYDVGFRPVLVVE